MVRRQPLPERTRPRSMTGEIIDRRYVVLERKGTNRYLVFDLQDLEQVQLRLRPGGAGYAICEKPDPSAAAEAAAQPRPASPVTACSRTRGALAAQPRPASPVTACSRTRGALAAPEARSRPAPQPATPISAPARRAAPTVPPPLPGDVARVATPIPPLSPPLSGASRATALEAAWFAHGDRLEEAEEADSLAGEPWDYPRYQQFLEQLARDLSAALFAEYALDPAE